MGNEFFLLHYLFFLVGNLNKKFNKLFEPNVQEKEKMKLTKRLEILLIEIKLQTFQKETFLVKFSRRFRGFQCKKSNDSTMTLITQIISRRNKIKKGFLTKMLSGK